MQLSRSTVRRGRFAAATLLVAALAGPSTALAQRSLGIDVSAWQGTIDWTKVRNSGIDFAFIRSSRGGTTGFYNQSDPNNLNGQNTFSQRYDDPYFVSNMANAKSKGIYVGAYHFLRGDIVSYTMNGATVTHTGLDEANHFLQQAGNTMRPGYLLPTLDVEAGDVERSTASLTAFVQAASDRIFEVKGIRPIIYIGGSYANGQVSASLNTHPLWIPRWPTAGTFDVQTDNPPGTGTYPNIYGVWNPTYPNTPNPAPWKFWQYSATGRNPGIGNGNANVDLDVANGGIEFLKDFLVPALWMVDADGAWTGGANWNGNPDLPTSLDRTIINRPAGDYLVTLASGTHAIRSLQLNERLNITGGSLAIEQYANLAGNTAISNGSVTAASIVNTAALSMSGGTVNAGSISNSATLAMTGGTVNASSISNAATVTMTGGSLTTPGALAGSGGTVNVTGGTLTVATLDQQTLTVGGTGVVRQSGTGASLVRGFFATGSGQFDLMAGSLAINYPVFTFLSGTRDALLNGRIVSSVLPANRTLAYGEAAALVGPSPTTWNGVGIDATTILVFPALRGDVTLDGTVNFADLLALAQRYGTTSGAIWTWGDFDYDGAVGFGDLLQLAQNYNPNAGATLASDWALAQSIVPEPATLLVALAGAPLMLRRRWRDRSAAR